MVRTLSCVPRRKLVEAIVKTDGRQFFLTEGQEFDVGSIPGEPGDIREFEELYDTPSKSEFQRNWTRLEQLARYKLPKEYRDRMAEARRKFGLK